MPDVIALWTYGICSIVALAFVVLGIVLWIAWNWKTAEENAEDEVIDDDDY